MQFSSGSAALSSRQSGGFFITLVLLCAMTISSAAAQTSGTHSSVPGALPVPLSHLYWHFLVLQNHLDRAANAHEQRGEDGTALRKYYQKKLAFDDAHFSVVRQAALRLEPELKAIDAEIKAVIDADHARHPRILASPADLPPLPPELAQLQRKRDQTIDYEVDSLKLALGRRQTDKLEDFLTQEFARSVTLQRVNVPRPHNDPTRHTVPAFPQQEVQP
jgi:hypothetical protein